ncbi:MAG TPA: carboxylating nicotinate-nucleotide diphosphorylase [Bacilli bacterium]
MAEWLNSLWLRRQIESWLQEDIGTGDVTAEATILADHRSNGIIHAKDDGLIAGLPVAELVFRTVDAQLAFTPRVAEGSPISRGDIVAEVSGRTRSILMGERLALNLLQRLSGIATKTRAFVSALDGLPARIVDTRKTTPGHRALEKYAVKVGGGHNHRFGLYDSVLIKDNHIKAAGGVMAAIERARARIPHTMKIEVEVERMDQLAEALRAKADIVMLDNMPPEQLRDAVRFIKHADPRIVTEASGGVSLENVRALAETGVDVISVGSLTYSFQSLDISLDLFAKKEAAQ